ncbi:MAG TPA: hypothetical protein VGT41_02640 [Candidatus Babeliales bacterium]|nr:hypothetical protein [Candidatus Babeliales bacterium]
MKRLLFLFLMAATALHAAQEVEQADYVFKLLTGQNLQTITSFMAQQRVEAFREYPYLYEGTVAEDTEYVQWLVGLQHSAVAASYLDGEPVGFVSGIAFVDNEQEFKGSCALFEENGLDPKDFYYVPEAIVAAAHRNKSLFTRLHSLLEEHVKSLGYKASCLVLESHEQHPLKPVDYKGPDEAFIKTGYSKTRMLTSCAWPTIQPDGPAKNQVHPLTYWIKNLKHDNPGNPKLLQAAMAVSARQN